MAFACPAHWLYPQNLAAARAAQREMAARLIAEDDLPPPPLRLGGADVSSHRADPARLLHAAMVCCDEKGGAVAIATESAIAAFPYIPGYLGFREVPPLVACWRSLAPKPDVLLVDGQGVAHPRGLGVAAHLGVVLGVPTIGVAKSLLIGEVGEEEPGPHPGDTAPVLWRGRVIAMALRSRHGARPIYISTGHRVSLATAVALVRGALRGHRLPPPLRAAHAAAHAARHRASPLSATVPAG